MTKKIFGILAILLVFLLISPVLADVFVPPGPRFEKAAYITPTLAVFNWNPTTKLASATQPIGWDYTDDVTFNPLTRTSGPYIDPEDPAVFTSTGLTTAAAALPSQTAIPYGQWVVVVGFIPGVTVAVDQVPPPVELQLKWNGIPNTITLTLPASRVVGINYPPTFYPDLTRPYEFAYPTLPKQNDTYNLWAGNSQYVLQKLWGTSNVPAWWNSVYGGQGDGEWFWYAFMPNTGDYITLNGNTGQIKGPPTYDITAQFEFATSQIWFNHVSFNVNALRVSKVVSYCTDQTLNDQIIITNTGILPITNLDLSQTFPSLNQFSVVPDYTTAMAQITSSSGAVVVPWTPLANFVSVAYPGAYNFSAPFNTLLPGQTMTVVMTINIFHVGTNFVGTMVFDARVSALQIAPWKYPQAIATLAYPINTIPTGAAVTLFTGNYLANSAVFGEAAGHIDFEPLAAIGGVSSAVPGPVLRIQMSIPMPSMTLDPLPVPLIAGETAVTAADVTLVQNAVLGQVSYDQRMDTNGNGRVDVQDLKAYEAAV
jgi:hypothetical protein